MEDNTIKCVGFIMDGNRRWAKKHGLETLEGHRRGGEVFSDSVEWVREAGIEHAVYYAFSTENWNRSEEEVSYLMNLFLEGIESVEKKYESKENPVRVRFIGRREDFSPELREKMTELEEKTAQAQNITSTIWVALSYGGRAEIIDGVNKAIKNGKQVSEVEFGKLLWTSGMPNPDLIIRTGGQQRLSNFLTWSSVYSELVFTPDYWPELSKDKFTAIIDDYNSRQRNFGK